MANAVRPLEHHPLEGSRVIHQVLHGYSEGHRQLESSLNLPDDLSRLMLRLSDLSGGDITTGFEEYLTGYPLGSTGMYALAKTWLAPEVPRPGCVWTHTLILGPDQLSACSFLPYLALFSRPRHREFKGEYSTPISCERIASKERVRSFFGNLDTGKRLLAAYYGKPERPVVLPSDSSNQYEEDIFNIWAQQWPTLRGKFSFSTGSLGARTHGGRPFEVQCVPVTLVRDVQLEMQTMRGGDAVVYGQTEVKAAPWSDLASEDLHLPGGGRLREFLWAATDESSGRADFSALVDIFTTIEQGGGVDVVISIVAEKYPTAQQGTGVKRLLFGERINHSYFQNSEEKDILGALGATEYYAIFDSADLRLRERGQVVGKDPHAARCLIARLFRHPLNPLSGEILVGLIATLDPQTARGIAVEQPQFLSTLLDVKPSLATSPNLWITVGNRKRELFASLERQSSMEPLIIKGVVSALLESGSDQFMGRAFQKWGRVAVFAALDHIAKETGSASVDCRMALAHYVDEVAAWLDKSPDTSPAMTVELAKIVAPRVDRLGERSTDIWERALDSDSNSVSDWDRQHLITLLLALALTNSRPHPLTIIGKTFEPIFFAAHDDRIADSAWDVLEPLFDSLPWPNGWDKCERMCRGLVKAFVLHGWPTEALPQCIHDSHVYARILKAATKVNGGGIFKKKQ